ncbi:16S rRNA (cytidine(1402)-2'-O)-methyltransferase [Myxococcota bacterium]|nr:16S rRNA (cytidine(1402)-2'-O)-methyltransferase [Myxococcota bacterium]
MITLSLAPYPELQPAIYLVPTPIGHLDDITLRALRTLATVDRIAAEDTRSARLLLNHFGLQKPLSSMHRDNESARTSALIDACKQGERIAYISEAGMPGISDPGYLLVQDAILSAVPVFALPGPSASITALVASGLPTDRFLFLGFLPHASARRKQALAPFAYLPLSIVLYVSPHRISDELDDIRSVLGDRQACIAREISKIHEEYLRGSLSSLQLELAQRNHKLGEMVLILQGVPPQIAAQAHAILSTTTDTMPLDADAALQQHAHQLLQSNAPLSQIAKQLSHHWPQITRQQAYALLQTLRHPDQTSNV